MDEEIAAKLAYARAGQIYARDKGDNRALAGWSQARFRALRAAGLLEVSDEPLAAWPPNATRTTR